MSVDFGVLFSDRETGVLFPQGHEVFHTSLRDNKQEREKRVMKLELPSGSTRLNTLSYPPYPIVTLFR